MKTAIPASLSKTNIEARLTGSSATPAITGISISLFMMNLDTSIVSVGLPEMIKNFNTTFATGQWFVLIYLLVLTALITGAGRLGDMFGKKKLYLAGIAIFTAASLLCAAAGSAASLIACRGIQGIGAALILSLGMAMATELTPKKNLGRIMGVLSTVTALGVASGPTIGGILLSAFGWQSMFLINIPFGIIAYWLVYKCVSPAATKSSMAIDWIGIILVAATLSCYCTGMTMIERRSPGSPLVLILLAAAAILLFTFVKVQQKISQPLLNLSIFKNKMIGRNLIVTVLVYTAITTTITLPPFYLSNAAGFSPLKVGLMMSFGPLLTVAFSVYAGKIADRYGAKKVIFFAVLTIAAGCLCMSAVKPGQSMGGYLWRIAIIQLGLTFFKTPNNTVIMEIARHDERGLLSSFLSLSRILGQITGTAVMGVIFAILSGVSTAAKNNATPQSIAYGFDKIFLINAFIVLLAALVYILNFSNKCLDRDKAMIIFKI